ncbi:TspO/MBR family protein [Haloparvum sedimenti]|uniref:TspO/MBR family protein n=1 Tax=Haloparvum sedimenti TaxID=1678448 RepID=UPI00071E8996|nr:TspO/MBR family protein [Haloparvum sedimenti]
MTPHWTRRDTVAAAGAAVACNLLGALGVPFTTPDAAWFRALELPAFYPPNWAFGVVWPILYALIGIAAYLVYREGRARDAAAVGMGGQKKGGLLPTDPTARLALGLFAVQLAVNVAWSPVFWGLQRVDLGLAVLVLLIGLVGATVAAFARVDRRAAALLVPYLAWVCFATVLNAAILFGN